MKKFLCYSTIAMTLFVLFTVLTFSAFAQSTGKYWEPVSDVQDTQGFVNGEISEKISSRAGDEKGTIIYSYDGEGKLTDWEFPLLNAGKDFEIVAKNGNNLKIKLINGCEEVPYVNAKVDFAFSSKVSESKTETTAKETVKTTSSNEKMTESFITTQTDLSNLPTDDIDFQKMERTNLKLIAACTIIIVACIIIIRIVIKKNRKH